MMLIRQKFATLIKILSHRKLLLSVFESIQRPNAKRSDRMPFHNQPLTSVLG